MANCAFGFANHVLDATVSADSEVAWLPAANIQSDQGGDTAAWRFTAPQATLTVDLGVGSARAFDVVTLHRTNLSNQAMADLLLYRDGELIWTLTAVPLAPIDGQAIVAAGIAAQADKMALTIREPAMTDGFVSIPLIYAGAWWVPFRNMSTQSTSGWDVGTDEATSLGGAEAPVNRWARRRAAVDHQSLSTADQPALRAMARWAQSGRNVLFVPDSGADAPSMAQDAIFGRLALGDLSNPFGAADRKRITLTMTERL